ncbi:MAG TPA: phage holin family protein, partial [Chthoniobacteraceae bacterium]
MTQQQPIGDLLKELRDETTTLFREEVTLVKKEMSEKLSQTTRNVGYLATGSLIAFAALIMLLFAGSSAV